MRLINEVDFYDVVKRHGNVLHIFAGHVHRTISGSSRGIPFSVFKSPVHQQPMPFDAPDASLSVDEPAAYGIAVMTDTMASWCIRRTTRSRSGKQGWLEGSTAPVGGTFL